MKRTSSSRPVPDPSLSYSTPAKKHKPQRYEPGTPTDDDSPGKLTRSPIGQGFDNLKESETWRWPKDLRGVRGKMEAYAKLPRSPQYTSLGPNKPLDFSIADFSVDTDQELREYIDELVQKNETSASMFGGKEPNVLPPSQYRVVTQNGKPVKLGGGAKGKIYLIQHIKTCELFAIKVYRDRESPEDIIKECSFIHKGDTLLKSNKEPASLHGYLQIDKDFASKNKIHHLIPVLTLVSVTPNVPVCLTMEQAYKMHQRKTPVLTIEQWCDVIVAIIRKTKKLFEGNVIHGDFHFGNILLAFHKNRTKVIVIDYDNARVRKATGTLDDYLEPYSDLGTMLFDFHKIVNELDMPLTTSCLSHYQTCVNQIFDEINYYQQNKDNLEANIDVTRETIERLSDKISHDRFINEINAAMDTDLANRPQETIDEEVSLASRGSSVRDSVRSMRRYFAPACVKKRTPSG